MRTRKTLGKSSTDIKTKSKHANILPTVSTTVKTPQSEAARPKITGRARPSSAAYGQYPVVVEVTVKAPPTKAYPQPAGAQSQRGKKR